jgi:iron transport multicopper oxidase
MTVEMCASICFNKGYNWMGVEYGQECYCNQEGPINSAAVALGGEKECNMLCKGDNMEFCGAGSRLNVYRKIGLLSTNKLVNARSAKFAGAYRAEKQ